MGTKLFLRVVSGSRQDTSVALKEDEPLVIGRVRGGLRLDDPQVSSSHCRIVFRNGHFLLQDLGSTNGTNVDGRPAQDVVLRPGAEIIVGNTRMVVFDVDDGTADSDDNGVAWLLENEPASTRSSLPALDPALRFVDDLSVTLRVLAGADRHQEFPITQAVSVIGRNGGDIPLSDAEVSRRHLSIEVFGNSMIFAHDLGSTNGSYHNGRRIHVARLGDGDTLGCGKTVMRFLRA